jgi:hypothetical protein
MRLCELEANRKSKPTNKLKVNTKTDFEQNVSKQKTKQRSLDAERPVKPVKPS